MRRQELHPRTAVINKNQKNLSRKERYDALNWLAKRFPKAFDNSQTIRPLKIGIREDILSYASEAEAEGISRSKLREAVSVFTRRIDYLACLKAREVRIDLNGDPTTQVTDEEAEKAAGKIKKRIDKSAKMSRSKLTTPTSAKTTNHYSYNRSNTSSYNQNRMGSSIKPAQGYSQNTYSPYVDHAALTSANTGTTRSAASVIVKHKSAKQYDPETVARLKEKLGLAKKREDDNKNDEMVD